MSGDGGGSGKGPHGTSLATSRGVLMGSSQLWEEMNAAIEVNRLKPVIDEMCLV